MRSTTIILFMFLCAACQKKNNTPPDTSKVVITITSPLQDQVFYSNDTLYINAEVSYISELHGYEVIVEDTVTGFTVFDEVQHVHSDHFVINDKWVNPVAQPTTFRLKISATVDHSGNVAMKELYFKITP